MNRSAIAKANSLLFDRDRLVATIGAVEAGSGVAVNIGGTYQSPDVVNSVLGVLSDHFRAKLTEIDRELTGLGWSGS